MCKGSVIAVIVTEYRVYRESLEEARYIYNVLDELVVSG